MFRNFIYIGYTSNNRIYINDTIIFDSVSRMSRNAEEGFNQYKDLFSKGINLVFLKEPHINTSVYKNAMQNQVALTGGKGKPPYCAY